jgi:hypothetical protein
MLHTLTKTCVLRIEIVGKNNTLAKERCPPEKEKKKKNLYGAVAVLEGLHQLNLMYACEGTSTHLTVRREAKGRKRRNEQ